MRKVEKVLFRMDKQKHYDRTYYYIVFPQEKTGDYTVLTSLPCYEWKGNSIPYGVRDGFMVESYDFMDINYYKNSTVLIHKGTEQANKLLNLLKELEPDTEFQVMEKLVR